MNLPTARKCLAGRRVELKVNSRSIAGWITAATAEWVEDLTPRRLHLRLVEPGQISRFELALTARPDGSMVLERAVVVGDLWGHPQAVELPGNTHIPASQCSNYWVGNLDITEHDNGKNNNGWAARIDGRVLALQLWPKREDRIRAEITRMSSLRDAELEFDTRE